MFLKLRCRCYLCVGTLKDFNLLAKQILALLPLPSSSNKLFGSYFTLHCKYILDGI